jgi:hypothetical protein
VIDFSPAKFELFCAKLRIDTKEFGRVPLLFMGSQRYAVEQIASGLAQGIHEFVILKGRQMGISTVTLALDMYWLFKYRGLQGAVVTDNDENRELFRSYLTQYIASLPPEARAPIEIHNRAQVVFKNNSRLMYMVAGEKKKGGLGRAKAVNMLHATECSSWGDEEGFMSLMNSLAQKNPNRLYVFESTARGYNMFYQTWETAKKSATQMAIFIGWWRNELYAWPQGSSQYDTYWDGVPTGDERVWIGEVFARYGHEVTPPQLAWWRWYCTEKMKGDEMMALQEMPPTEDYAFQLSGSKFFSAERVNMNYQRALTQECLYFRYIFGPNFEDTQFVQATAETGEIALYETPVIATLPAERSGCYVLGADPAYGSSEWADEFALCIVRCYADRVVQVAELGTPDWTEQQFAWAIAHLCGWYQDCMLNLEMLGPGGAVLNELTNLKQKAGHLAPADPRAGAFDVIGRIRDYLYRKQDSVTASVALQWQTTPKEKIRMMSTLRSYFEREIIEVNSPLCLQQFRNIHRQGDSIGGEGRAKDDRVIALGLAVIGWNDWILAELSAQGRTFAREHRPTEPARAITVVENSVIKYLNRHHIKLPGVN